MEMKRGFSLLLQQTRTLVVKNFLLESRNKWATVMQLLSPLLCVAMLYAVQVATMCTFTQTTVFETVRKPTPSGFLPILRCEDMFYVKTPCFDFVWSGNDSARITAIVDAIRANNAGRPIPAFKVASFRTMEDVDAWLLNHPMKCAAALHFAEVNSSVVSYGIQTNYTSYKRGMFEESTFKLQLPLQMAAEREIARSLLGEPGLRWEFGVKEFAHPARRRISPLNIIGPVFFLSIFALGFFKQINSLVEEKELKFRQAMTMNGLSHSAYWLSWLIWDAISIFVSSNFIILTGRLFRFQFFLKIDFAVLFTLFSLFQLSMTGLAYIASNFISKSLTGTACGFSIFIISFFTQVVTTFGFPYRTNVSPAWRTIWGLFPPNVLAESMVILIRSTADPEPAGLTWRERNQCSSEFSECHFKLDDAYRLLPTSFVLWFLIAIYLDNVLPNPNGTRKSLLFWLDPRYWTGEGNVRVQDESICRCFRSAPQFGSIIPDDEDVLQEEAAVRNRVLDGTVNSVAAVQILGLCKGYPSPVKSGCLKCKMNAPQEAVKNLWLNLMKDQLFCLLGPNGAGKTTLVNCLTGVRTVTSGDALIYGQSIRSTNGISNIQRLVGLCPQFDMLWDELTGEEHLHIYANLKGIPPSEIKSVAEKLLANVNLTDAGKMRAGSYSGGMRRRLSLAIALIGEPKLLILDEPTTGSDPISRNLVWDIIKREKEGRVTILITHSMEEADILSDRIGVMVKGRLRCLGTSIYLKSKFGAGIVISIIFSDYQKEHGELKELFEKHLNVVPTEEHVSFITFVIPREKELVLTEFFVELQERVEEFGIVDIQLRLATLEEVFLRVGMEAEIENGKAEGRYATLTLASGATVEVPIGTERLHIPGGDVAEIKWALDESGCLCISGHSLLPPSYSDR